MRSDWTRERTSAALLLLAAALILALAAERLWLIPLHVSFNPNEGWNAYQAQRAFGTGGPLYPAPDALTGDNYPPLSFLLVGGLAKLTGADPIMVGRVVSVLAVLATAAGAAAVVRRLQPTCTLAPAAAALVVLGFAATQFRGYLAMNDPQWLAQAVMTPALALLLPGDADAAPRAGRVAAAAALVVLALLIKHNLLALPAAATLWLAWRHRSALVVWIGAGAVLATGAGAAVLWAYGPDAAADILGAPRSTSWVRMFRSAAGPLAAELPLMAVAAGLLRLRSRDPRLDLILLFAAVAVPLGVLQRAGEGVNYNAHFEATVALSIAAGVALAHALAAADRRRAGWTAAAAALPLIVLAPLTAQATAREIASLPVETRSWAELERRIAGEPGAVACETPTLCFWAGRPFVLDVFLYGQRLSARGGGAGERALLDGRIAAIERDPDRARKPGDRPNPVFALLDRRSTPAFTAEDGRRLDTLRP